MKRLAVIPARGGSKRIPRKNLREFAGRPIIAHSIHAARDSGLFDVVLVSTDDEEIAAVSREQGADVPFLRPVELADDHTGTQAVVRQAIEAVAAWRSMPEQVCCIYATAPFVRATDLAAGLASLTHPATTTETADRVGISLPSASQHTTVLRNAGLITTTRTGTAVLHTLTPLGTALLRSDNAARAGRR